LWGLFDVRGLAYVSLHDRPVDNVLLFKNNCLAEHTILHQYTVVEASEFEHFLERYKKSNSFSY